MEEQEFTFVFNILEASLLKKECPYFVVSACLHQCKYYFSEFEVVPSTDVKKRAVILVDKANNQNFLDFIDLFKLSKEFGNEYMVTRAKDALAKEDLNAVGKIMLAKHLFSEFDCLDICLKLGEKGGNNRKLVIDILAVQPKFTDQLVERFSTEKEFEFAFDIVQAFKLPLRKYPTLQTIKSSRHPIVDMAFTDPKTDTKHVPLHVMEDLISGDQRLLQKLFFALVKTEQTHKACGVYLRNMFP